MRRSVLLILLTLSGPNLAVQTRSLKLIEEILKNFRKGKSQSSSWRSPPQQDIHRPNSESYGAPQSPVISRPNYSDDYGSPRAPVIKSNEYGAPLSPVISRPNYPAQSWYNQGPLNDYNSHHYGGGRPLYTEDQYQYYPPLPPGPPGPPACSCNENYQQYPPHYNVVQPTLPPQPPAPVTTTTSRPEPCLELYTTLEFQLESPEMSVAPGSQCEFIILPANNVCSLSLTFSWFFLPSSLNCTEEFLQIGDNRLCGQLTDRQGDRPLTRTSV